VLSRPEGTLVQVKKLVDIRIEGELDTGWFIVSPHLIIRKNRWKIA